VFLNLDDKDILQINATIIAGDFIFLTLIAGVFPKGNVATALPITISIIIIMIFSLSSYFLLRGQRDPSIDLMKVGFGMIFLFAITVLLVLTINGLRDSISSLFYEITNQTISNQTRIGLV
jgi:hypothetical protein